jgi:hypothetical protein
MAPELESLRCIDKVEIRVFGIGRIYIHRSRVVVTGTHRSECVGIDVISDFSHESICLWVIAFHELGRGAGHFFWMWRWKNHFAFSTALSEFLVLKYFSLAWPHILRK